MSCDNCHGLFGKCRPNSWFCKRCYGIINALDNVGDDFRVWNESFKKQNGYSLKRKDWPKLVLMDEIIQLRQEVADLKGFKKPVNEWANAPWLKCDEAK